MEIDKVSPLFCSGLQVVGDGDCYHTAQFFPFHAFFLYFVSQFLQRQKLRQGKSPEDEVEVTMFSWAIYTLLFCLRRDKPLRLRFTAASYKLWLDKSVLAACRRGSECTVLFVGLCVRAALERNMSPNIFLCQEPPDFVSACYCYASVYFVAVLVDLRCRMTSLKFTTEKQVVLAQSCGLPLISAQSARSFQAIE